MYIPCSLDGVYVCFFFVLHMCLDCFIVQHIAVVCFIVHEKPVYARRERLVLGCFVLDRENLNLKT